MLPKFDFDPVTGPLEQHSGLRLSRLALRCLQVHLASFGDGDTINLGELPVPDGLRHIRFAIPLSRLYLHSLEVLRPLFLELGPDTAEPNLIGFTDVRVVPVANALVRAVAEVIVDVPRLLRTDDFKGLL